MIDIEVVYAGARHQLVLSVTVPKGCTAEQAVCASGILEALGERAPDELDLGVFGKKVRSDYTLEQGDRVEIYRALKVDPKEARRIRGQRSEGRGRKKEPRTTGHRPPSRQR